MAFWLTIEVQNGEFPASEWRRARGDLLIEAAVTNGARSWKWHTPRWGVVLELRFRDERLRDAFRLLPAVVAALDAVPDPVFGLFVYAGRGGGSTTGRPRRPRPSPVAGVATEEEPRSELVDLASR